MARCYNQYHIPVLELDTNTVSYLSWYELIFKGASGCKAKPQ